MGVSFGLPGVPAAWPEAERGLWKGCGVPADVPGLTILAGVPLVGLLPKAMRGWKGEALTGLGRAGTGSGAAAAGALASAAELAAPRRELGLGGLAKEKGAGLMGGLLDI